MNRPLFAWSIYGICLLLTFCAVTWLTRSAWQADQARQRALQDSEIQNALWQLDSLVAPLLAIEMNRPSLSASFSNSPMLDPKLIKGYVVRDATGKWTIRPDGRATRRTELPGDSPLIVMDWNSRLRPRKSELASGSSSDLANSSPSLTTGDHLVWQVAGQGGQMGGGQGGGFGGGIGGGQGGQVGAEQSGQFGGVGQSTQIRSQLVQQFQQAAANSQQPNQIGPQPPFAFIPLQPVWVSNELVLARVNSASTKPSERIVEICWLNWTEWEKLLRSQLAEISIPLQMRPSDVLPGRAEWQPNSRQMVSLPIRLEPQSKIVSESWPRTLIAVWGLLILVAIASAGLLQQTLNLSERRAAFVSAVTHELRTPLTTFRLYTELLSEGIAKDPEQQQTYFQTLNREANRLTHLVENVLAYARLEHGRSTARNETLTCGDLIDRCQPRLEQRVAETPLTLSIQISAITTKSMLTTNCLAVEQILFNLIDNACKYARDTADPRITVEVRTECSHVCIAVSDFGPGLSATAHRSLFQPFQKSSSQAAESAPGIGLGLALSYRIARELGGSLRCIPNVPTGLCMELRLPISVQGHD